MKRKAFAEQHHHGLSMPEAVNVRHEVGETFDDDTVKDRCKPEVDVTSSATESYTTALYAILPHLLQETFHLLLSSSSISPSSSPMFHTHSSLVVSNSRTYIVSTLAALITLLNRTPHLLLFLDKV